MNANTIKNAVLTAISCTGSVLANHLGGCDAALKILIGFMAADYATGILVALVWHSSRKSVGGGLSSNESFKGLVRKMAILFLVWIGAMLDEVVGERYVRTSVMLFFIANEGLSIIENTAIMGVPYPKTLKKTLEVLRQTGDGGGEVDE